MIIRTPFVAAGCLGFIGGVAVASACDAYLGMVPVFTTIALVAAVAAVVAVWRSPRHGVRGRIAATAAVAAMFGIIRFTVALSTVMPAAFSVGDVMLEGRVVRVDEHSVGGILLRIADVRTVEQGVPSRLLGNRLPLQVVAPRAMSSVRYGDRIRARCTPTPVRHARDRWVIAGTCAVRDARTITVVGRGAGNTAAGTLLAFRDRLIATVDRQLPSPAAGIVDGVLLGVDRGIPADLRNAFRATGTIHILVVSGWHMSFIGLQLRRLLARVGLPRVVRLLVPAVVLAAFTVMVGAAPAAVRGALVVAAILLVDATGRIANPVRMLLLTAVAMVAWQPYVLADDLSFQLSFAATAGIILGTPIVEAWLRSIGRWCTRSTVVTAACDRCPAVLRAWGTELRALIAASLAASLATAPLILMVFGTFAPLAPLMNVPVLLLVPPILATGTSVLLLTAFPFTGALAAWAATAFGRALASIVTWAATLPGSAVAVATIDGWFVACAYLLAGCAVVWWHRRRGIPMLTTIPSGLLAPARG